MGEYTNPPSKIMISILLCVAVIGGFISFMSDMNEYNAVIPTSQLYSNITEHENTLIEKATILSEQTADEAAIVPGFSLIGLVYNGLQTMWITIKSTFDIIPEMGKAFSETWGFPVWFTTTIVAIILIMSAAAIIKVITGREV